MKMKQTHVMLDIETLGTTAGSIVAAIAAVAFCPITGTKLAETSFLAFPSTADQQRAGMTMDAATVKFWIARTEPAAQQFVFAAETFDPSLVLDKLREWFDDIKVKAKELGALGGVRVWGHGASFDPVLLESLHKAFGKSPPWAFRFVRDTRTIFDLAGMDYKAAHYIESGVQHTPLVDAMAQVSAVCEAYRLLKLQVQEQGFAYTVAPALASVESL